MEKYTVPGTNLNVSKICFGTMTFGGRIPEKEGIDLIGSALADGVNFFDTADSYNEGQAEIIIGKAIAGRRDQVVLASKVYYPANAKDDEGLAPARMRSHLEASLRRLNTDYLDLYYLHQPDKNTPLGETLKQMDQFLREGKVRYYGVSNYAAWQIADIFALADRLGMPAPVVTQNVYNALTRGIEAELMPFSASRNLPIVTYNPLAGGLLTGRYSLAEVDRDGRLIIDEEYNRRYMSRRNLNAVTELADLAKQTGRPLVEIALLWVYQNPAIASLILGVSSAAQYRQNMAILNGEPLKAEVIEKISVIGEAYFHAGFAYYR